MNLIKYGLTFKSADRKPTIPALIEQITQITNKKIGV